MGQQLDCVFSDIRPDAVKIGMVSNADIIRVIARKLREYAAENIVVDPVMVSTSGSPLLSPTAQEALIGELLPMGRVITPNIPEAEALCGNKIKNRRDMRRAAAMMTDRSLIRQRLLRPVETIGGQGHIATSLLRPAKTDDWDYANESRRQWANPYDEKMTSRDSFFDLYELAADEAVTMIGEFLEALPEGKSMLAITQDRGFSSDLPGIYTEK